MRTFKPNIQQPVNKGDIEVQQKHHRLQEIESERPNQRHHYNVFASHLFRHQLRLTLELVVA